MSAPFLDLGVPICADCGTTDGDLIVAMKLQGDNLVALWFCHPHAVARNLAPERAGPPGSVYVANEQASDWPDPEDVFTSGERPCANACGLAAAAGDIFCEGCGSARERSTFLAESGQDEL